MTAVTALPQLEQRRGQERKRAGLRFDIGEQPVDELGLHAQPAGARRALDRPSQLTAAHRSHEHVVGTQHPAELAVLAAASVEVGAHGDDDGRGRRGQERIDERRPLARVATQREELLELVDGDQPVPLSADPLEGSQRVLAGAQQRLRPRLAAGQDAAGELGQQPGAHRG